MNKIARSIAIIFATFGFIALGAGMANAEVISQSTSEEDHMILTEEGTSHEDSAPIKIGMPHSPGIVTDKSESSIPTPQLRHLVQVPVVEPLTGVVVGYDWVWVEANEPPPAAVFIHF